MATTDKNEQPSTGEIRERYYDAKRVRKSLGHFLIGKGLTAIASFSVALIVVQNLSVSDYSGLTALSGLLILMMCLTSGGLERVIPRYFPQLREASAESELKLFCRNLFVIRLGLLVSGIAIMVLLARPIFDWLNLNNSSSLLVSFSLYCLSYGLYTHLMRSLQALLLQKQATFGQAIDSYSKLAGVIVWVYFLDSLSLTEAVYIYTATSTLGAFYMLLALRSHLIIFSTDTKTSAGNVLDYNNVKALGWQNYLQLIAGWHASASAAKIVGVHFLTGGGAAVLGFSFAMMQVIRRYLPATLLLGLIEPAVIAKYTEKRDFSILNRHVSSVLKFNLVALMPATIWFYLAGDPIVSLLTGGKYLDSTWVISCLLVLLMMESHRLVLQLVCNAIEHSELLLKSNLVSLLLWPVVIVLIASIGLPGLVLGFIGISVLQNFLIVIYLRRFDYEYNPDWINILRLVLVSLTAVPLAFLLSSWMGISGVAEAVVSGIIVFPLYVMGVISFSPFTQSERSMLRRYIKFGDKRKQKLANSDIV